MINDNDKLDEILRNAAQDYNRPPGIVPRDEMWAAIEAAQTERARRPLHMVAPAPRRSIRRYTWLGIAAAAVLLIATGVGIGRWSTLSIPASAPGVASQKVATTQGPAAPSVNPTNEPAPASDRVSEEGSVRGQSAVRSQSAVRNQSAVRSESVVRSPQLGSREPVGSYSSPPAGYRTEVPYQVATIRHLANAEALLTAFRTDSRDAKMDAQLSAWARDLLSNTRLLLDSPAADDPQRARLLGDLELVLAEIVQLSPGASAQDRGLIEGSIR
ncbi:MAG TPA: hypothetical protein VGJ64_03450, partial [Gemmatimonadaceae bacterium]